MLDAAPNKTNIQNIYSLPMKANDCIADPANYSPPQMLFDRFWREGELTLFFGPPGTGKTVLAVQIADALARGRAIDGFAMPIRRRRVLYVDLVHSGDQFHARRVDSNGSFYRFSENLDRGVPNDPQKLIEWMRAVIEENHYKVVIIDDLASLRTAADGSRESLTTMRDLKRLKNELGISILVISPSREPRTHERVSESCLMRSRVLCDVADSVFAVGRHERQPEWLYLMQIRSRTAAIHWTRDNAPYARVGRTDNGLLVMQFDERFEPKLDAGTRRRIIELKALRETHSIRKIAEMTGLTRSRVERLIKKWRPSMLDETENRIAELYPKEIEPEEEEDTVDEIGWERPEGWSEPAEIHDEPDHFAFLESGACGYPEPEPSPVLEEPSNGQDKIFEACGCWRGEDVNGRFVWVEEADARGKPIVMYQPHRNGFTRWKYTGVGKMGLEVHGPVHVRSDFT